MNNNQKLLASLIAAAIRGKTPRAVTNRKINWQKIFQAAKLHHVEALLYYSLKKMNKELYLKESLMSGWEKDMLITGLVQMRNMQQMRNVLGAFRQEGISVIVLKGLVLRALYPRPEHRTMSDGDILVYGEDMERARELLLKMGYREEDTSPSHIHFSHSAHLPIELHHTLADEKYAPGVACFEKNIWDDAVAADIFGLPALMLSYEDQIVHLCLHMAVHFQNGGYGLRQLCDLVLLVEAIGHDICWDSFYKKTRQCGIEQFVLSVFTVCKRLFNMEVPKGLSLDFTVNENLMKLLIRDIFAGGAFGRGTLARDYGNAVLNRRGTEETYGIWVKVKYLLALFFPSPENISKQYAYVRKYPLLIPAAWVHHLISGAFNNNYSLFDKLTFFFAAGLVSRRRTKLLQWLEL